MASTVMLVTPLAGTNQGISVAIPMATDSTIRVPCQTGEVADNEREEEEVVEERKEANRVATGSAWQRQVAPRRITTLLEFMIARWSSNYSVGRA